VIASLGNDAGQVGAATMAFRGGLTALRYSRFFLALVLALDLSVRSQSGDSIHKIRHIVIIMQENRSFDSYFGRFPGLTSIAMSNGVRRFAFPPRPAPASGLPRSRTAIEAARTVRMRRLPISTADGWSASSGPPNAGGGEFAGIPMRPTAGHG